MNTKPILFSTPMVQAILNGTKLQTRRVVKGKALEWITTGMLPPDVLTRPDTFICPYGEVGDVLWVRETFCKMPEPDSFGYFLYLASQDKPYGKWKPSIHMPKEACRLFLKIKDIRVERLQDISEQDAVKEGIQRIKEDGMLSFRSYAVNYDACVFPYVSFETLWKKINGNESWNENPWVWVIEFERIEKPENF